MKNNKKNRTDKIMKLLFTLGIIWFSILYYNWWGLLSLLIMFPFIPWPERLKRQFIKNKNQKTTHYEFAVQLRKQVPNSFILMQDILIKASKETTTPGDLLDQLKLLRYNLIMEEYTSHDLSDSAILNEFLKQFSMVFPNWQNEYAKLYVLIDSDFI